MYRYIYIHVCRLRRILEVRRGKLTWPDRFRSPHRDIYFRESGYFFACQDCTNNPWRRSELLFRELLEGMHSQKTRPTAEDPLRVPPGVYRYEGRRTGKRERERGETALPERSWKGERETRIKDRLIHWGSDEERDTSKTGQQVEVGWGYRLIPVPQHRERRTRGFSDAESRLGLQPKEDNRRNTLKKKFTKIRYFFCFPESQRAKVDWVFLKSFFFFLFISGTAKTQSRCTDIIDHRVLAARRAG